MTDDPRRPVTGLTCGEAQPLLGLYADGEFEPGEQPALEDHLAHCAECSRKVHAGRAFRVRLGQAVREADALALPPHFAARLGRRVSHTRVAHRVGRMALPLAAAAALVGFLTLTSSDALTAVADESVQRHADQGSVDFASQDAAVLERILTERIGHSLRVPQFGATGMAVRGARLVQLHDRPAAQVVYRTARARISLLAVPDPQRQLDLDDERLPRPEGRPLHVARKNGLTVVIWRQSDTVYSMVSELGAPELVRLLLDNGQRPPRRERFERPPLPSVPVSF
ncbi:MAG: zf-HC2 domain-containing protein [Deltaproteobacteria bacterium]|nr:zf-HC2 domain-containing protein [Deltaproteobacteria bacterium]